MRRVLKCSRSFFAEVGPIPGNPSRMNWSCSFSESELFDARRDDSGRVCFFARTEMNFAVSCELSEKMMGTLYSRIVESRNPRKAFSCRPEF